MNDFFFKNMWYLHTIESYLALKRKKVLIHAIICMNLDIMPNERSHTQKDKSCMIYSDEIPRVAKFRDRKWNGVSGKGQRRQGTRRLFDGYRVSFWEDEKVL